MSSRSVRPIRRCPSPRAGTEGFDRSASRSTTKSTSSTCGRCAISSRSNHRTPSVVRASKLVRSSPCTSRASNTIPTTCPGSPAGLLLSEPTREDSQHRAQRRSESGFLSELGERPLPPTRPSPDRHPASSTSRCEDDPARRGASATAARSYPDRRHTPPPYARQHPSHQDAIPRGDHERPNRRVEFPDGSARGRVPGVDFVAQTRAAAVGATFNGTRIRSGIGRRMASTSRADRRAGGPFVIKLVAKDGADGPRIAG